MIVSPGKAPCLVYTTYRQQPQIKYTDYCIFSGRITWNSYDSCWHSWYNRKGCPS